MARRKSANAIKAMLDRFLQSRVMSDGGSWPEVSDKDMEALYSLFHAIIDAKWELDCDGDSVINFQIVNRKKYAPIFHIPIPYEHHAKNMGELLDIASSYGGRARSAAGDVDRMLNYIRIVRQEAEKRGVTPDEYLAMSSR